MNKARVMFVDDEVAILDGLRDLLRKDRHRWEMVFAQSGEQALAELAQRRFDIVVSDMRMPGMDGAELGRIKAQHPRVTRIVLSGHAERDAVLRAMPVAHQFLGKPCDAGVLRATIERTYRLKSLLANEAVRAVVGNVSQLPSVPETYLALTRVASDASKGVAELAAIIETDPAMSAKVLQLAGSAYFGSARAISSVERAVRHLGVACIKGLALSAGIFSSLQRQSPNLSLEALHVAETARLVRRLAPGGEEAFTAALLHDIGEIIIAQQLPDQLTEIARRAQSSGEPWHVAERAVLGVTHGEVGAYLLGVWGLPFNIVEAVAYHHEPSRVGDGPCEVLAVLHAANALGAGHRLDVDFLARAGYGDALVHWREIARAG